MKNWLTEIIRQTGELLIRIIQLSGFSLIVLLTIVPYLKNIFRRRYEIFKQMYIAGVRTLGVISIVALFTGMILALQSGITMKLYHIEELVGNLVAATMTREMGTFTAAIILIASVGSAMAAEIGTMKVSEEIDALQIMTINPVDFLVMPRIVGLTLMMPVATIYTIVLGCLGGALVAKTHLNVSYEMYYFRVLESLYVKDMYVAMFKALVFGLIISSISCAAGLRAKNGAMGVGRATRNSVVASFLMILIIGYYITEIFYAGNL